MNSIETRTSLLAEPWTVRNAARRSEDLIYEFFPGYNPDAEIAEVWLPSKFGFWVHDVLARTSECPEGLNDAQIDQIEDLAILHALHKVTQIKAEWAERGLL